jgi:tyrosyl-tRNA synthetase
MWRYFELLSLRTGPEVDRLREEAAGGRNPRDIKFLLAEELVARFHDEATARQARERFVARFQQGALPEDMPEVTVQAQGDSIPLPAMLRLAGLVESTSDGQRMVRQGAVRIDGERADDPGTRVEAGAYTVQVGKRRVARVTVVKENA